MENVDLATTVTTAREWMSRMKEVGIDLTDCYQCGKCTAGCPMAHAMDYSPRKIIRMLQLGLAEQALKSNTIWVCASCEVCATRCPRDIEIVKIMDILRIEATRLGVAALPHVPIFHRTFLESVKNHGRVAETELMLKFNMRSGKLFNNVDLGPKMMQKGKLHLFPPKVDDGGAVKKLYARVQEMGVE